MRSRKLIIYEDKKTRAIFLNPTKVVGNRFLLKSPAKNYGAAISGRTVSNADLGKAVKDALKECD